MSLIKVATASLQSLAAKSANTTATELRQQRNQASGLARITGRNTSNGRIKAVTLAGDKIEGEYFGDRPPLVGAMHGYYRQEGSGKVTIVSR